MSNSSPRALASRGAAFFNQPGVFPLLPGNGTHVSPDRAALERIDWAGTLQFSSFGLRLAVRADEPAMLERAARHLTLVGTPASDGSPDLLYSLVTAQANTRGRGARIHTPGGYTLVRRRRDHLLECLDSLTRIDVAVQNPLGLVFVHAGVVGWHGRALLLVGRSRTGKSRMVRALVEAGATYLSDEYAPLDAGGRVFPFARPLSLRQGPGQPRLPVPGETLGTVARDPLPVELVLSCRYRRNGLWQPRPLTAGEALFALLDNTVGATQRPALTFHVLGRLVERAHAYRGSRGPAEETAGCLLNLLSNVHRMPEGGPGAV